MSFFKKHPIICAFLFIGIVLFIIGISLHVSSEVIVKSGVRLLIYISLGLLSFGLYGLFVVRKKVILANIVLVMVLLLGVEVFCFIKLHRPDLVKKDFSLPLLPDNHIAMNVGSVPWADSVLHSVLVVENDTVYDVNYSIDHNNKRSTPEHDSSKTKYALFFGCSITFGEGVEDNQTMPYYFQTNSDYNSYNFALSGQGTNHVLARFQYDPLTKQVDEKDGLAIYVFYWDHLYRAVGTMNRYYDWLCHAPYYTWENDSLVRKKLFKNGRYFTSKMYENLHELNTVKYFGLDFPVKLNVQHLNLVAEMVLQTEKEYRAQFGNDNFYCAIYPDWGDKPHDLQTEFIEILRQKGIKVVDLTDFKYEAKHSLGLDGHPNPRTHETMAKTLLERIPH